MESDQILEGVTKFPDFFFFFYPNKTFLDQGFSNVVLQAKTFSLAILKKEKY